jgi:paraquat-inducible protein B
LKALAGGPLAGASISGNRRAILGVAAASDRKAQHDHRLSQSRNRSGAFPWSEQAQVRLLSRRPVTEGEDERTHVPEATERRSRWGGWIWALPIAALAIVGYLGIKEFTQQGPSVTVIFATAGGVKANDTKVQYEGLQVGEVESVKLQKDMRHVEVSLSLHSDMDGHLGPGTRFWIDGQKPSISDLSSLKSVVTGPFIGVDPHEGPKQDHYEGLTEPPVIKEKVAGTNYTLHAATIGAVSRGSSIYYHDLEVGTVQNTELQPGGDQFKILVFVRAPFDKLVHEGTRFWNASAIQVSMTGPGPRVQFQSVPALLAGAVSFETPADVTAGAQAKDGESFKLYDSKDAADDAPDARFVSYHVTFQAADAGGLQTDAPVKLADSHVGSVQHNELQYDPQSGQLAWQVTIAIDPSRIRLANGEAWQPNARQQMNALMQHLIAQGLRARLGKTVPLVGNDAVLLEFVPKAKPASLGTGDVPEIPTAPGSDIEGLMASASGFTAKLNAMPLDQIADDIHQTTQKLAELSNSPQLKESLDHLDQTLTSVDRVARDARDQVGPILAKIRGVANEAQSTVASARSLLASNGMVQNQPGTTGMGNALYELSRAARSLRELADYLDRHPEALLKGKG